MHTIRSMKERNDEVDDNARIRARRKDALNGEAHRRDDNVGVHV